MSNLRRHQQTHSQHKGQIRLSKDLSPPGDLHVGREKKNRKSKKLHSNLEISRTRDQKGECLRKISDLSYANSTGTPWSLGLLIPAPKDTVSSDFLTMMMAQTGPRKLQMNPRSVFSQQLWKERAVSACLSLDPTVTPTPANALMEESIERWPWDENSHDMAGYSSVFFGTQQVFFQTFLLGKYPWSIH